MQPFFAISGLVIAALTAPAPGAVADRSPSDQVEIAIVSTTGTACPDDETFEIRTSLPDFTADHPDIRLTKGDLVFCEFRIDVRVAAGVTAFADLTLGGYSSLSSGAHAVMSVSNRIVGGAASPPEHHAVSGPTSLGVYRAGFYRALGTPLETDTTLPVVVRVEFRVVGDPFGIEPGDGFAVLSYTNFAFRALVPSWKTAPPIG